MKRTLLIAVACLWVAGSPLAHDLFLRFAESFLPPHQDVTVSLLNGTFERSDNTITRDRMVDVSIVGPGDEIAHPEEGAWRDEGDTTRLDFTTGPAGTYTIGVSTKPRMIELSGEAFDGYLDHDGVDDVLAERERLGLLGTKAHERYSKHVKALFQVGEVRSAGFEAELGYPIEILPRQNPYELGVGDVLEVQVKKDGAPLAGQLVYASHAGFHEHDDAGRHVEACRTRTDAQGLARIPLTQSGAWYVRLIHMVPVEEEGVDYESLWATLTFSLPESEGALSTWNVETLAIVVGIVLLLVVLRGRSKAAA